MEKERNITKGDYYFVENFWMVKGGMEKEKNMQTIIMKILILKENI